jgi:hypothetical protein
MHLLKIHIMKKKNTIALISFVLSSAINLFGHCQVPCGIFADQHRFEQMLEDQSTIEKASRLISELSGKKRRIICKPTHSLGSNQRRPCQCHTKDNC